MTISILMTGLKNSLSFLSTTVLLLLMAFPGRAQINLHTDDLPRFYQAFDSVITTKDTAKQAVFIQKLYVDRASQGLKEFMVLRGGSTANWRAFIEKDQTALLQKRPWILSVLEQETEIRNRIALFKRIYPAFRDGDIYFCVGINNSGGTIDNRTVYIGTEVAASSQPNWAVPLVLHEFVHTQQWTQRNKDRILQSAQLEKQYTASHKQLLGKCLEEGMADFIAELVYEQPLAAVHPDGHIAFGLKHEQLIWDAFKQEMYAEFNWKGGWLYGKREIAGQQVRDLGYFVGYQICKHYYQKATNKQAAIRYMIELNLTDENAKRFLSASGYELAKKVSY
ncbi:DUF2268 domain-containing putative Zn-dependent protease [Spirosoma koreense]